MECVTATVTLLVLVFLLTLRSLFRWIFPKIEIKKAGYKEEWFGQGVKPESGGDTSVRSFKISVSDEVLKDLKERLLRTRLEEPLEDSRFHYGFNPSYLKEVVEYWRTDYDWRKQEASLNSFEHYKTQIEGIDIHFMHAKPKEGQHLKVIPLMILHGWPGSIVEFLKLVPLLTQPREGSDFVFEVVCPSLPGFGFSESPCRKGLNARACARIFVTLMERIGHNSFYVQGGDWGSCIASLMARYYAPRVRGLHVNMYFFIPTSWDWLKLMAVAIFPSLVTPEEYKSIFPLGKLVKLMLKEGGYYHIQATKPDTLGSAMSDSPAGTAAYLLEKFAAGTDIAHLDLRDGGLTRKFSLDELLTNVMLYWVGNNFTAAARFYKENNRDVLRKVHERFPVMVPCGIAFFPHEVLMFPRIGMSQQIKDLVSYTVMPRGGHFAAMEEPQLLADDIFNFVSKVESRQN